MLTFVTPCTKPLQYLSCGRFISDQPFLHSARELDNFVILFGITGEMHMACDGYTYVLKPGSLLLLPPHIMHYGTEPTKSMLSYYWCHFSCQEPYRMLDSETAEVKALLTGQQDSGILLPMFEEIASVDRPMLIFQQMMHIAYTQYRCHCTANYALSLLAAELSEQCFRPTQTVARKPAKLSEITEWIRINLGRPITVQGLADKFEYSSDYLSAMFRKHLGTSVVKYIRDLRINRAKELLLHSQKQVQEIAYEVGYTDEKYFMRQFKAVENMSPTNFRNAYSRIHMNNR